MTSTLSPNFAKFAALISAKMGELKAAHEKIARADLNAGIRDLERLSNEYSVSRHLFRGNDFFKECARKQVCRDLKAA